MRYARHVADLVGDTPLVQLSRVTDGIAATVLAKVVDLLDPRAGVVEIMAQASMIVDNDFFKHKVFFRPSGKGKATEFFEMKKTRTILASLAFAYRTHRLIAAAAAVE